MQKNRLEAFSDGVLAIIITIMVLELKVPRSVELAALKPLLPVFLSYVLSFIVAIPLALVCPWLSSGLHIFVALLWLIPDRRIERVLEPHEN
jgi:uncharacterized membrane protein